MNWMEPMACLFLTLNWSYGWNVYESLESHEKKEKVFCTFLVFMAWIRILGNNFFSIRKMFHWNLGTNEHESLYKAYRFIYFFYFHIKTWKQDANQYQLIFFLDQNFNLKFAKLNWMISSLLCHSITRFCNVSFAVL